MSVLPPIATELRTSLVVRKVPNPEVAVQKEKAVRRRALNSNLMIGIRRPLMLALASGDEMRGRRACEIWPSCVARAALRCHRDPLVAPDGGSAFTYGLPGSSATHINVRMHAGQPQHFP
jgi:hypothetical protein